MYIKYTIKNYLRSPLLFILFVTLITLTTCLFILQYCIYDKGRTELNRTRQAYQVVGDISLIEEGLSDVNDTFQYILSDQDRSLLMTSPFIKRIDFRRSLFGRIDGIYLLSPEKYSLFRDSYILGHVLSSKLSTVSSAQYWILQVAVDEVCYSKEDLDDIIELQIPADDEEFLYEKLLQGDRYYFGQIWTDENLSYQPKYHITAPSLSNVIYSEEDTKIYPDVYTPYLTMIKNIKAMANAFPLMYTNDILCIPDFFNGIASISQGRAFNTEEYESGSRVCVISEELALSEGLAVGDSIDISVTNELAYQEFRNGERYFGDFYKARFEPTEAYEIIGLYKCKNNDREDPQYFSNNTIFIPANSWLTALSQNFWTEEYYAFRTSFVLSAPDVTYQLLEHLRKVGFDFNKYSITVYDQGYELIRMILKNMMDSSFSLLIISGVSILMVLALLVYLYMIRRKKEYSIMRVMGETIHKASLIFYLGILFIGVLGTLSGTLIAGSIAGSMVLKAYETGQEAALADGMEGGAYSDAYVFDAEVPISDLLIPALVILLLLILLCLVGNIQLRKRSLLRLIHSGAEL